jgi:fucose permease
VVTVAGLLLIGFGLAPIFPIILAYLSEQYSHLSGTAIGLAMALALMGGSIFPYLAAVIGSAFGLRAAFLLMPAAIIVALNLFTIARRYVTVQTPQSVQ